MAASKSNDFFWSAACGNEAGNTASDVEDQVQRRHNQWRYQEVTLRAGVLVMIGLTTACGGAQADGTIQNTLDACISLAPARISQVESSLFLPTAWTVHKTTGECGCKSALISYRVTAGAQKELIATGVLSSMNKKSYAFLINPDAGIKYGDKYALFVGCAS